MTDIQAAVGLVQLGRLDGMVARRRELAARYAERAGRVARPAPRRGPGVGDDATSSRSGCMLPEDFPVGRDELLGRWPTAGISARRGIMASHLEPAYAGARRAAPLPVTERLTATSLILPLYHELTRGRAGPGGRRCCAQRRGRRGRPVTDAPAAARRRRRARPGDRWPRSRPRAGRGRPRWRLSALDDDPRPARRRRRRRAGARPVGRWCTTSRTPRCWSASAARADRGSGPRLAAALGLPDERYATVVHPAASVAGGTRVGAGTVLLAGCVVTAPQRVGRHVVVMPHVLLTHDDEVGDFVTLAGGSPWPAACGRDGRVPRRGGAGPRGMTVGAGALVGMGAVVLADVPAGETWAGNPARPLPAPGRGRGCEGPRLRPPAGARRNPDERHRARGGGPRPARPRRRAVRRARAGCRARRGAGSAAAAGPGRRPPPVAAASCGRCGRPSGGAARPHPRLGLAAVLRRLLRRARSCTASRCCAR